MELKQIKELMAAMGRTGVMRLMIKDDGFELELEREENGILKPYDQMDSDDISRRSDFELRATDALSKGAADVSSARLSSKQNAEVKEDVNAIYVTSPMVGTFYSSPSPEEPGFVKIGEKIDKNTVVCIVEAMKVMNEIKANVTGTVSEVLVESGHPVEFGTKLFRIT